MKFRIAEIFGPTIQGEGRNVGIPCHFVRFGGCDYRCTWCDTPHAVLPQQVAGLERMEEWQIVSAVNRLDSAAHNFVPWIVLTGGNPALVNLNPLIDHLHDQERKVMLETQGSVFREWFGKVDDLCFSPKPPSSTMRWDFKDFDRILTSTLKAQAHWAEAEKREEHQPPYLKVPIFSEDDLNFAYQVHSCWPSFEMFLSIGNDDPSLPTVGNPNPGPAFDQAVTTGHVLENQRHWTERILQDPRFADVRIFSQQHVLLWGNSRGH